MPRDPNLKALTVYVDKSVYELVRTAAGAEDRSVTNFLARLVAGHFSALPVRVVESAGHADRRWRAGGRIGNSVSEQTRGQVDLESAIAAAVKRGPVKLARHK